MGVSQNIQGHLFYDMQSRGRKVASYPRQFGKKAQKIYFQGRKWPEVGSGVESGEDWNLFYILGVVLFVLINRG